MRNKHSAQAMDQFILNPNHTPDVMEQSQVNIRSQKYRCGTKHDIRSKKRVTVDKLTSEKDIND